MAYNVNDGGETRTVYVDGVFPRGSGSKVECPRRPFQGQPSEYRPLTGRVHPVAEFLVGPLGHDPERRPERYEQSGVLNPW